jgi:hypothetical protein
MAVLPPESGIFLPNRAGKDLCTETVTSAAFIGYQLKGADSNNPKAEIYCDTKIILTYINSLLYNDNIR